MTNPQVRDVANRENAFIVVNTLHAWQLAIAFTVSIRDLHKRLEALAVTYLQDAARI